MDGDLEDARSALVQEDWREHHCTPNRKISASVVGTYVHSNEKIGVMIGLDGGSQELAKDIAMHVAASIQWSLIQTTLIKRYQKEKEIFAARQRNSGKPLKSLRR